MIYDSSGETNDHRIKVFSYCINFAKSIAMRGKDHDHSKLETPEKKYFDKYTPLLKSLKYGSKEYKESLENLKPALDHHYSVNRHHPEHFKNGVNDMNIVDLVEMLCDWKAASLRTKGGSLIDSLDYNCKRFNIEDQLKSIILNTIKAQNWEKGDEV